MYHNVTIKHMHESELRTLYSACSGSAESTALLSAFNEDNKIHEENAFEWYLEAFAAFAFEEFLCRKIGKTKMLYTVSSH